MEQEKKPIVVEEAKVKIIDNASLCQSTSNISEEDLEELMPKMQVSVPSQPMQEAPPLISDPKYLDLLDEIANNIREDRKQCAEFVDNLADMVMNNGDATSASKEALVNMVKIKTDCQDKMLKVADLMTRVKLKNPYAYSGPHLNALQQNNFNLGTTDKNFNQKELIRAINKVKKKKEKNV